MITSCKISSCECHGNPLMTSQHCLSWWTKKGSGYGLVPSSNKPLPEPMLIQINVAIWCQWKLTYSQKRWHMQQIIKWCYDLFHSNQLITCIEFWFDDCKFLVPWVNQYIEFCAAVHMYMHGLCIHYGHGTFVCYWGGVSKTLMSS